MDEELLGWIEQARGGDRVAFGKLVAAIQDRAVAFAYGRLGDTELARDVAQDAFIDAFARLPQLRAAAAFFTWFRSVLLKHCDRRYRRKALDVRELASLQPAHSTPDSESNAIEAERASGLRASIDGLPEGQRTVVALHYLADQSLEQIAELLAIEPNAVKQRLFAARKRLRETAIEPTRRSSMESIMRTARASNDPLFSETIQLFLATRCGDVELVRALLRGNPALVDARECWNPDAFEGHALPFPANASPLIRAAELGQLEIVALLLKQGADVDGACGCLTREPPLWAAVASNRIEVAKLLLEHGADPNRAGASGITPLHIASMRGSSELAELLLAYGAVTALPDPGGRTAADWASHKGHAALAARLREPSAADSSVHGEAQRTCSPVGPIWHSGIKALDLWAPIAQGALVRVEGGAGVGRNVLLAELAYNASCDPETAVLWVNWERERWSGSELDQLLHETALRGRVHVLRHAHGDDPQAGHVLAERALTFADGLLASGGALRIQLVFFEQPGVRAGVEALLPALRARPSITTFIVGPWQDVGEHTTLAPPYDALLAFDPALARARLFPALDPWKSRSRTIPELAGGEIADAARALLRRDEPRAHCLRAYLTQPFFVAEPNSGRPGENVARADMLADVAALLDDTATPPARELLLYRGRAPASH